MDPADHLKRAPLSSESPSQAPGERVAAWLLGFCLVWAVAVYGLIASVVFLNEESKPDDKAIIGMAGGLLVIWVLLGGFVMFRYRGVFVGWVARWTVGWKTRFVLLCTALALIEEAVTTTMTNTAPLYGDVTAGARITASANYLEVVLLNSVVVFVPMYIAWAWLLGRYAFRPLEVMLLYGITGVVAETMSFGLQNLGLAGMWVWVYGLMVYLPACTVPVHRGARPLLWWHRPMAVIVPIVAAMPLVPLVVLVNKALGYTMPG